ncbi:hypothetical protein [Nostoc punctiforme]|uniref:hypothetical protein n=1 Tax=Nostoc punctiforme TaxID=272131 RepID=UPI003B0067C4
MWNCGTWNCGIWNCGTWNCGIWNCGTWNCGTWNCGTWNCSIGGKDAPPITHFISASESSSTSTWLKLSCALFFIFAISLLLGLKNTGIHQ